MSTQFIIQGLNRHALKSALIKQGMTVNDIHDQGGSYVGSAVRFHDRDVGRVTAVSFSEYQWRLEISTGWCPWPTIRQILDTLNSSGAQL